MAPESDPTLRFSLRSLLLGLTLCAVCFAAIAFLFQRQAAWSAVQRRIAKEQLRIAELDKMAIAAIVKEVEALRTKLGRAPKDVVEVEQLLGKPMPTIHKGPLKSPIHYLRTGENSFALRYQFSSGGDWYYRSDYPTSGWVKSFN